MSQSCFSLGFLSQNSLCKLFTMRGYKGYLYWCVFGMQKISFSYNRVVWWLGLTTRLSHEFKLRANCLASLELLSCSAIAGVTFQLPCMLRTCASFGDLPAASHSWDPVASPWFFAQSWAFLHTLSHTTLTWFPPKYKVSKCWITSKLAQNKAKKMVD